MASQRKLPNSDETRIVALNAAKTKKDNTAPGDIVLSANTQTRLDVIQPLYAQNMLARGVALHTQGVATKLKVTTMGKARMFISHFIQVLNLCIERGVFIAEDRTYYLLDINSNSVPQLDTEDLVLLWGQRLIDGDAARVAAGGAAMGFPTIAQVTTEFNAFKNASIAQSAAKDAYDRAQAEVSGMRTDVDNLILRMWNEVEAAFSEEEIESKRRLSREWGVVYISTQESTITGVVTNSLNGNVLKDVNVAIIETGNIVQTIVDGTYTLITTITGVCNLEFSLTGFVTQTFPIDLPEGGSLTQNVALVSV